MVKREDFTALRVVVELAVGIFLPLLGGVYLGRFLGQRYGRPTLCLLVGILCGLLSGLRQAWRVLFKK